MDFRLSILLVILTAVVTWLIARSRQKRFESEFYLISGLSGSDIKTSLNWLEAQSLTIQKRMNRLYVLCGILACRINQLESAKATFTTDRIVTRLEATLEEVTNAEHEPDEIILKSKEHLQECSILVRQAAKALLHQLAIETTRKTASLITTKEGRHHFRLAMDSFGRLMHKGGVLADEMDQLVAEPLIDDAETETQTESSV